MKKIPFDLSLWLQDKSRKVVNSKGKEVRIICWDREGEWPIIGLTENRLIQQYDENGVIIHFGGEKWEPDLFLVTEDELTEFEKGLLEFADKRDEYEYDSDKVCELNEKVIELTHTYSAKLLSIARKQIESEPKAYLDLSMDAIEACMLRYLQSAANRKNDCEVIEDTREYKKQLVDLIQKPAEWSEEDEDNLLNCIEIVRDFEIDYEDSNPKYSDWLKSLKNRGNFPKSNTNSPSWKPSEEQMEALEETIEFAPDTFKPKCTLESLYNELKKKED